MSDLKSAFYSLLYCHLKKGRIEDIMQVSDRFFLLQ